MVDVLLLVHSHVASDDIYSTVVAGIWTDEKMSKYKGKERVSPQPRKGQGFLYFACF